LILADLFCRGQNTRAIPPFTLETTMKKLMIALTAGALLVGGAVLAKDKEPAENVSAKKHPNLAAAQKMIGNAFEKIEAAQKANEFDLGGHAAKAKELLEKAADELKQAAETANENKK
jgi:hypothetical protein